MSRKQRLYAPLVAAAWSLTAARSRLKALSAAPWKPDCPAPWSWRRPSWRRMGERNCLAARVVNMVAGVLRGEEWRVSIDRCGMALLLTFNQITGRCASLLGIEVVLTTSHHLFAEELPMGKVRAAASHRLVGILPCANISIWTSSPTWNI